MTDNLKPCPFCGGEAWLTKRKSDYDGTILYGGRCINTGCCEIPAIYTKTAAISKWNTRKPMDRIVERLEAEIESSDKYIREYDDSEVQKAWNKGLRNSLEIVKGVKDE